MESWESKIVGHERVRADQLMANPFNHRLHPKEQRRLVAASISEIGFVKSVIVNKQTGHIVDGHERVMQALGISDGTLVDVEYVDLTPEEERKALLLLDSTSELATVDASQLQELCSGISWDSADLESFGQQQLLDAVGTVNAITNDDDVPEPSESKSCMVELGDVWQLGPHRIACGDSTNVATVSKLLGSETPLLMVTDPPYGVNYDANWRNERLAESGSRSTGEVLNDDRADWTEAWNLFPGSICYVWTASLSSPIVYESLKQSAFEIRSQIVWTKPGLIVGRGNYHWQHEPALVGVRGDQTIEPDGECETGWYAVKQKAKALFVGGRKQSTVWQAWFSQSDAKTPHSTQKPVALFARAMINHGSVGDAVYDPFLGSGTSIVAAHRTGRRCFGLELNPLYCEIIIKRFEALTGIKAIKLNDKTS